MTPIRPNSHAPVCRVGIPPPLEGLVNFIVGHSDEIDALENNGGCLGFGKESQEHKLVVVGDIFSNVRVDRIFHPLREPFGMIESIGCPNSV